MKGKQPIKTSKNVQLMIKNVMTHQQISLQQPNVMNSKNSGAQTIHSKYSDLDLENMTKNTKNPRNLLSSMNLTANNFRETNNKDQFLKQSKTMQQFKKKQYFSKQNSSQVSPKHKSYSNISQNIKDGVLENQEKIVKLPSFKYETQKSLHNQTQNTQTNQSQKQLTERELLQLKNEYQRKRDRENQTIILSKLKKRQSTLTVKEQNQLTDYIQNNQKQVQFPISRKQSQETNIQMYKNNLVKHKNSMQDLNVNYENTKFKYNQNVPQEAGFLSGKALKFIKLKDYEQNQQNLVKKTQSLKRNTDSINKNYKNYLLSQNYYLEKEKSNRENENLKKIEREEFYKQQNKTGGFYFKKQNSDNFGASGYKTHQNIGYQSQSSKNQSQQNFYNSSQQQKQQKTYEQLKQTYIKSKSVQNNPEFYSCTAAPKLQDLVNEQLYKNIEQLQNDEYKKQSAQQFIKQEPLITHLKKKRIKQYTASQTPFNNSQMSMGGSLIQKEGIITPMYIKNNPIESIQDHINNQNQKYSHKKSDFKKKFHKINPENCEIDETYLFTEEKYYDQIEEEEPKYFSPLKSQIEGFYDVEDNLSQHEDDKFQVQKETEYDEEHIFDYREEFEKEDKSNQEKIQRMIKLVEGNPMNQKILDMKQQGIDKQKLNLVYQNNNDPQYHEKQRIKKQLKNIQLKQQSNKIKLMTDEELEQEKIKQEILADNKSSDIRRMVSEKNRSKQKISNIMLALKKALLYLHKLNIDPADLHKNLIFSTKAFQKKNSKEMIQAAKFGDYDSVLLYLSYNKYLVYDFDHLFMTPLHWACKRGHYLIVKKLIEYNSDIDQKDLLGRTPLYFAIQSGELQIVRHLLINKASPWCFSKHLNLKEICKPGGRMQALLDRFRKMDIILKICNPKVKNQIWSVNTFIINENNSNDRESPRSIYDHLNLQD